MKQFAVALAGLIFMADSQVGDSLLLPRRATIDQSTVRDEVTTFLGAIIRGDQSTGKIALVFTGHEFGDGLPSIIRTLNGAQIHASFFLTGSFYRNEDFRSCITELRDLGHYLGSHSDKHLLYCDWADRDSLLVTRAAFEKDINDSYETLKTFGIDKKQARYFLPPYEWYNETIASWTNDMGLQLVNFTPGTRSTADYTYPEMGERYVDNQTIVRSIVDHEQTDEHGLNGFILLSHVGTDPRRQEKFYDELPWLIHALKSKGYRFVRIDELLTPSPGG